MAYTPASTFGDFELLLGAAVKLWSFNRVSLADRFWKYLGFQLRSRTNGCRGLRSQRECGVNSGLEIPKVGKGRSW